MTVGDFRDWLLSETTTTEVLARLAPGLTPEMAAAVSKIMRNQDLILAAKKVEVVTRFRDTIGLKGRMSVRVCSRTTRPMIPSAALPPPCVDGLMLRLRRCRHRHQPGKRQRQRHPQTCSPCSMTLISRFEIPTQSCVLTHVTTSIEAIASRRARGPRVPVDRRHRSRECVVRRHPGNAQGRARGSVVAEARHGRRQRHVLRDRPGLGPVGRRASRRRSADARSPRLRSRPRRSNRCWSTRSSASSAPSISTTARRSSAPASRTISAASSWACRWDATSATPTTPKPIRTTWTCC